MENLENVVTIPCIQNEPCHNFKCPFNLLWEGLEFRRAKETEASMGANNCQFQISREYILEEIGEMYGITRERVRQIERKAIIKILKQSLYNKDLKQFIDGHGWLDNKGIQNKLDLLSDAARQYEPGPVGGQMEEFVGQIKNNA